MKIVIGLNKFYDIYENDDQIITFSIKTFDELVNYLNGKEFNSIGIRFSTVNDPKLAKREKATYTRRMNRVCALFGMEIMLISNVNIGGYTFPNKYFAALTKESK